MNHFELIQYGYLGLLALMLIVGGRLVSTYISTTNPPKKSLYAISAFFLLSVVGGVAGYFWAGKELEASQAQNQTASIIQQELTNARERLNSAVGSLRVARNKALEQSVYGGNMTSTQERHRIRAKEITEMIELQENRFERELNSIAQAFSGVDPRSKRDDT